MKRLLIIIISMIMLVSLVVPISAQEQVATITEAEAGALINKAVELYDKIHLTPPMGTISDSDKIQITVSYYVYCDGIYDTYQNHTLCLVIDESKLPGGSYEALPEYARSIYTEDIADSMYNTCAKSFYDLDAPMFYTSASGELYMHEDIGYDWTEVKPWYYGETDQRQFTADNIDIVYADNEKATVRYLTELDRDEDRYYGWVECYLVNTEDGWRITDSPFTKMLRHERYAKELWEPNVIRYEDYKESPSTADPSFDSFVLLPAVSLACLVPAFYLLRRRRRNRPVA